MSEQKSAHDFPVLPIFSAYPLLPAWTETRRNIDIAIAILARLRAWSRTHATAAAMTLPDGAILTVHVAPDGGEFYSTIGGSAVDAPQAKYWRREAWNFDGGVAIVLPHLNDVCCECYGFCGDVRLVAGEWTDCDCPACDGTGARRGSEAYNARMARIAAMRRKAANELLPV